MSAQGDLTGPVEGRPGEAGTDRYAATETPGTPTVTGSRRIGGKSTYGTTSPSLDGAASSWRRVMGGTLVIAGAWGALAPFVGPLFGYTPLGTGAWHWDAMRAILSVGPGVIAAVAGLALLGLGGRARFASLFVSWLALLAGAWFVLGTFSWPTFHAALHAPTYVPTLAPMARLANQVGTFQGLGTVVALLAAFAMAATLRGQRAPTTTTT